MITRLKEALKSKAFYPKAALALAAWYAVLELLSRLASRLCGKETLIGIDFLPSRESLDFQPEFDLVACLRFRDEAPFLREWIEYHLLIGVQHFVLYNNNSEDDFRSVLAPYIERGVVELRNWPVVPASPAADLDCIRCFRERARWIAFIDADEFIVPVKASSLTEVLAKVANQNGLAINWRLFGSSFIRERVPGLITENFRLCGSLDRHVKCIVNPRRVIKYGNSHFWYFTNLQTVRNEAGKNVYGSYFWAGDCQEIVINHYYFKSAADYLAKARQKGRVDAAGVKLKTRPENWLEGGFRENNDSTDSTIDRWLPMLRSRLAADVDRIT